MKYTKSIGLGFHHFDADVNVTFIYKPGRLPEGPEIEILKIEVFWITTNSGNVLEADWLKDRGWYKFACELVQKEFDAVYEPGGSIWHDLLEVVWE